MPNPQLLTDAAKGDRRAQYQLYQQCFNVLMSVCVRYRNGHDDAAAIVNAGYLKIVQNLGKYRPDTPFEAWIRRIMINVLIDDFRKNRKVTELIEHRDFSGNYEKASPIELNDADLQFNAEQLEAMIRTLPPMSQKVFNLFAIDGYSHKEIGEMLGISDGTSKWHLSFARQRLQERMRNASNAERLECGMRNKE